MPNFDPKESTFYSNVFWTLCIIVRVWFFGRSNSPQVTWKTCSFETTKKWLWLKTLLSFWRKILESHFGRLWSEGFICIWRRIRMLISCTKVILRTLLTFLICFSCRWTNRRLTSLTMMKAWCYLISILFSRFLRKERNCFREVGTSLWILLIKDWPLFCLSLTLWSIGRFLKAKRMWLISIHSHLWLIELWSIYLGFIWCTKIDSCWYPKSVLIFFISNWTNVLSIEWIPL